MSTPLKISFGVLLFPGYQLLDAACPIDIINCHSLAILDNIPALESFRDKMPLIEWYYISSTGTLDPIKASAGPLQPPNATFDTCPPLDYLLVPGPSPTMKLSDECIAFVKTRFAEIKGLLTVCSGSIVLAQTGVLDGYQAASNKIALAEFAKHGILNKKVKWVGDKRWVIDGKVWSAAGGSSGMDLACEWVRVHLDHDWVEVGKNYMEYTPLPDQPDAFAYLTKGVNFD